MTDEQARDVAVAIRKVLLEVAAGRLSAESPQARRLLLRMQGALVALETQARSC